MMRIVTTFLVFGLACISPVFGQDVPATQPDRSTQREAFEKLLDQLDAVRLDPALVDGDEIQAARAKIKAAIGQFQTGLNQEWNDQHGLPLADRDYLMFRNACSPWLNGKVVKVGPGQEFPDLATAVPNIRPGMLVWLGRGEFNLGQLGPQFNLSDVAFVGQGPESTRLIGGRGSGLQFASRIRIDQVRVDCQDDPFIDVDKGGRLHLRDCRIENYNSGAGGSNSIYMADSVLLVEGCAFDGANGRAARPGSGGDAFDLRSTWSMFARQCQFLENDEIVRVDGPTFFDGCLMINTHAGGYGVSPGRQLVLRDSESVISPRRGGNDDFSRTSVCTDDLRLVEHAAGFRKEADGEMEMLVRGLALSRRLPYWIGLIRHDDAAIRTIAAKRLSELIDIEVNLPVEAQIENETLADLGVLFKSEVEFTRLMTWFEQHRDQLLWDQAEGRYRLKQP